MRIPEKLSPIPDQGLLDLGFAYDHLPIQRPPSLPHCALAHHLTAIGDLV